MVPAAWATINLFAVIASFVLACRLSGVAVTISHQEADQPGITLAHRLRRDVEGDPGPVDDREVRRKHPVEGKETMVEHLDRDRAHDHDVVVEHGRSGELGLGSGEIQHAGGERGRGDQAARADAADQRDSAGECDGE